MEDALERFKSAILSSTERVYVVDRAANNEAELRAATIVSSPAAAWLETGSFPEAEREGTAISVCGLASDGRAFVIAPLDPTHIAVGASISGVTLSFATP